MKRIYSGDYGVVCELYSHPCSVQAVVLLLSSACVIDGLIAMWQFRYMQSAGFIDAGEVVKEVEELKDTGISFFMTFVIPLLLDNIRLWSDFIVFVTLVLMVVRLMIKTNLFYQNPVLILLGYRVYRLKFDNPSVKKLENKSVIVISRSLIQSNKVVKWKFISDDVFIMYHKNKGEKL